MQSSFEFVEALQNATVNARTNRKFQLLMQQAILLGLRDMDLISQVQLYRTEEIIKQQYIDGIRSIETEEISND